MNTPSNGELDQLLMQKFNLDIHAIQKLAKNDQENKQLDRYRGALSLWAEYSQDTKQKIIVTLDGRDTAGKGSNIKRVTEYWNDSKWDKKAFGIPSAEEKFKFNWFDRYKAFFPKQGGTRFFDRSWYNRAGVEAAMGFCTAEEYNWFMDHVNQFEKDHIIDMGYDFIKVYLSITKDTQKRRLENRETEMKRWKSSMIDAKAQEKWNYYTLAKHKILEHTDTQYAPWTVIDSNEKFLSATEIMKAIINTSDEVSQIVSNKLEIDLHPNPKITRTADQELEKMQKSESITKMKDQFHFAEVA